MIDNFGSYEDEDDDSQFERPSETNLTEQALVSIATEEDACPVSEDDEGYRGRLADIYAFS